MQRIFGFMDPWSDAYGKGYQLSHSLIAFGRGEIFGVGLGGSVEKLHWLPEAHERLVRPGLHPALEQPSLLGYAWRTYVYPGRREMYDGSAMVFPEIDTDLDWVEPQRRSDRAPETSSALPA